MTSRFWAYLELIRPANVVTAFADVIAGFAAAGAFRRLLMPMETAEASNQLLSLGLTEDLLWLLLSTAGLYGGGVVLNDVFDAELDAIERPERAIPSGRIPKSRARTLGIGLLGIGIVAASFVNLTALVVAALVAGCAVLYDAAGKHHRVLGPINMGLCRGGNLVLGMSVMPAIIAELWFLALIPIVYVGAVTAISAGEVGGGSRSTGVLAILLVGMVVTALLLLGIRLDYRVWHALPFAALLSLLVFPTYARAAAHPVPDKLRLAVKVGVLSLVVMDAALAAGFAGWPAGLIVLALLPISMLLARLFAVT